MNKLTIASLIAGVLTTGLIGLASPAQADIGHHIWVNTISQPSVYVPHVDTSVHH